MINMIPEIKGSSEKNFIVLVLRPGKTGQHCLPHTIVSVSLAMDNQHTLLFGQEQ